MEDHLAVIKRSSSKAARLPQTVLECWEMSRQGDQRAVCHMATAAYCGIDPLPRRIGAGLQHRLHNVAASAS